MKGEVALARVRVRVRVRARARARGWRPDTRSGDLRPVGGGEHEEGLPPRVHAVLVRVGVKG